jgi:hypothetical protein
MFLDPEIVANVADQIGAAFAPENGHGETSIT